MTFVVDVEQCPNLGCRYPRPPTGWGELLEAGDIIDRNYRVLERLAIGGAGVTYLGREIDQDGNEEGPKVAIKLLYQQRDQGSYLRRLATEAQIIQGLNHPSIVEYRGFVHRAGHSPYLITRYEAGGSLLDHIRRVGVLGIPVVAAIGQQVCSALAVAHAQGVVHRDLKPENVLLERQVAVGEVPRLRVADFGIAKVAGGMGERLTRVGAFVGTPQFAAPEQFEGMPPSPATDVYSTGAMLFFCMVGRPVAGHMDELDADQQLEHLLNHLPARLDLPEEPAHLCQQLEQILARAMVVDPEGRCTMQELERLLGELVPGHLTHQPLDTPASGEAGVSPSVDLNKARTRSSRPPVVPPADPTLDPRSQSLPPADPRPSPEVIPHEKPKPPRSARTESSSGWGCGILTLTLLFLVLVVGAVGAGYWWYDTQQSATPVQLTASETDPVRKAEWLLVTEALSKVALPAARNCKAPRNAQLDVIIDETGKLQTLSILSYDNESVRSCMANQLAKTPIPRKMVGSVRLIVGLSVP